MAKIVANAVVARGDRPFNEAWMTDVNEVWWEIHGRWVCALTRMLLEPPTEAVEMALTE